jgi:putative spermidine/putrescine transport system substrate-binding protein/spermidine/putrescine transport system substrate-binding protein
MTLALNRRSVLAGAAGLAALGAAAHPARASTQVSWVGWQGYDEPLKAGTFLADAGIELVTTYINTNEEILTKLQAGGRGQVDLVTIYYGHVPLMAALDLAEPIDESRVPGIGSIFPEFLNVDVLRRDGKLYGVPFTWGTLSMVYDPAATATPTSWRDCLKEEVRGKVAMVDDMTGLIATWAPIAVGTTTPTRINLEQLRTTLDLLIEIKTKHARTFSPSYGEATDLFARGEVVTSAIGWDAMVGFAAAKGKQLAYAIPVEGAMVFMDTLVIPSGAPHRDLAYALIGQSVSAAGQKVIADQLTQAIITREAVPLVSEENRRIYQYDNLPALFERAKFYPFWPLEPEGDLVTFDQVIEEYQRFLKA